MVGAGDVVGTAEGDTVVVGADDSVGASVGGIVVVGIMVGDVVGTVRGLPSEGLEATGALVGEPLSGFPATGDRVPPEGASAVVGEEVGLPGVEGPPSGDNEPPFVVGDEGFPAGGWDDVGEPATGAGEGIPGTFVATDMKISEKALALKKQ